MDHLDFTHQLISLLRQARGDASTDPAEAKAPSRPSAPDPGDSPADPSPDTDPEDSEDSPSSPPIQVDDTPENQDWLKGSWDLPPYGSPEFLALLQSLDLTLEDFQKLPIYRQALAQGLIRDGKWTGKPDTSDTDDD